MGGGRVGDPGARSIWTCVVRDVAVLVIEERSEDAIVDVSELRFEDGGRVRDGGGGGGGGVGLVACGRTSTAYETCAGPDAEEDREEQGGEAVADDGFRGRCGSLGGSGRRTYSAQSLGSEETLGLTMDDAETFSNESSRLTLSGSWLFSALRSSRSMG